MKNATPFSQFLRLRRLCSDESDFNRKCARKCASFSKNVATLIPLSPHRAQEIDQHVTERRNQQNSIHSHLPSTRLCGQKCHSQKLQNSLQYNDPETKHVFPLSPLISFKRDRNICNFMLVKKGQNIKMCYLHNKSDIHVSSGCTCASRLLYIHQNSPYKYQRSYLHVKRCYTYIKII